MLTILINERPPALAAAYLPVVLPTAKAHTPVVGQWSVLDRTRRTGFVSALLITTQNSNTPNYMGNTSAQGAGKGTSLGHHKVQRDEARGIPPRGRPVQTPDLTAHLEAAEPVTGIRGLSVLPDSIHKITEYDEEEGEVNREMTLAFAPLDLGVELGTDLPCRQYDPDLWFADTPADLEVAKALCGGCPLRAECLAGAIERAEPWGVWGGEIFERGAVVPRKRPRGRPRKEDLARDAVLRVEVANHNRELAVAGVLVEVA